MSHLGYLLALGLACLFGGGVAYDAWQNRPAAGTRPLTATALATAVWAGGTAGLVLAEAPAAKLRWLQVSYLGMVAAPISFLLLALEYAGYQRYVRPSLVGALLAAGGLVLALVWTNPLHHLYWADLTYGPKTPAGVNTTPGPAFWGFVAFTYVQLAAGSFVLVRYALTAPHLYRSQSVALLAAVAAPWAANVPHVFQLMASDYTPVALAVTASTLWTAMHQYRLGDLSPIALRTVFESISTGVFVLDRQDRVVDVNAAGKNLLGLSDPVIGTSFDALMPSDSLLDRLADPSTDFPLLVTGDALLSERPGSDAAGERHDASAPASPSERYFAVQMTPIQAAGRRQEGRLITLRDVTERERQQRRLEHKNEQLERFASVVSHDLRNPLNVAVGNLSIAAEHLDLPPPEADRTNGQTADPPDADDLRPPLRRVQRALGRMTTLIDDLLTLAAGGTDISDPEPVDLATVATDAWDSVETKGATLRPRTGAAVRARRSRLQQLLENLFHNAIVHGGPGTTVTVGDRPDGFYVADDGPGFPDEAKDALFEAGYTTREDGTGFGLSIVREIADAHGWSLKLGTSAAGGARIDILSGDGSPSTDDADARDSSVGA
ncbi:MAG: histidine kinase N-terminal 7TM domain-containing protein [Salinivenus sp.]